MGTQYYHPKAVLEILETYGQFPSPDEMPTGDAGDTIDSVIKRWYAERGLEYQAGDCLRYRNVERGANILEWPGGMILGTRDGQGNWTGVL